ncbi:hypothetical protein ABE504_03530 [Paenibacillus oryzisoli]|uniref:hypothetical protein n=1 Tax=Paenibacillus oryzisoli TaxID=1850517 RepID=UPI003D26FC7C
MFVNKKEPLDLEDDIPANHLVCVVNAVVNLLDDAVHDDGIFSDWARRKPLISCRRERFVVRLAAQSKGYRYVIAGIMDGGTQTTLSSAAETQKGAERVMESWRSRMR